MSVLKLLSFVGMSGAFIFLTLAIASGLYFISEQVEEHTVFTKKLLTQIIYSIIAIHVLLLVFDGFPFKITVFSILVNFIYLQNLKRFPFISLSSGIFITSCFSVVLNHYLWFKYFTDNSIPPYAIYNTNPYYQGKVHPPFAQVSSFLGLCVWLVPFALFISLSASDNVLPTSLHQAGPHHSHGGALSEEDESATAKARRKSTGLAKALISFGYVYIVKIARVFGFNLEDQGGLPLS
ncbi:hypothetical protein DV451_000447 [Geotrichum candidum]|uniref:Similar to Saccharomyces cerevisiae YHR181W SVP26 Integral membrane protein of the early Golgi apparatus and endoplasmic reticulum, involved in COP II vesicle transport n=1 Tax=Geotrichum candidum TaxID=1173061 RepID=A0A0J9XHJ4_GEOCN|nr:hypothetical protein DV451_000447 [Geotrichum candidum]KAI9211770.1 hypothetical protein DS838_003365 [Geotrichum bryndzae]KAF5108343.1 hypothetical protein DV453_002303 [Geotrichum candidum]KAF5121500.1 hypothetical protein DV452_000771 [Geotrichum candidum]KAF7501905.1 hypothetical protein DV113_000039 [Geotrichum candidum]